MRSRDRQEQPPASLPGAPGTWLDPQQRRSAPADRWATDRCATHPGQRSDPQPGTLGSARSLFAAGAAIDRRRPEQASRRPLRARQGSGCSTFSTAPSVAVNLWPADPSQRQHRVPASSQLGSAWPGGPPRPRRPASRRSHHPWAPIQTPSQPASPSSDSPSAPPAAGLCPQPRRRSKRHRASRRQS